MLLEYSPVRSLTCALADRVYNRRRKRKRGAHLDAGEDQVAMQRNECASSLRER